MVNIVYQLLSCERKLQKNPNKDELPFDHISQYAPFYEIDPHWEESTDDLIPKSRTAHEALGYRIFNTHLRWDMLPKGMLEKSAKYIYVVRDGRDVLTSFYHHLSNQHPEDGGFTGDFEAFFQQFLDGTIAYGKWSHHLASWMPHCVGEQKKDEVLLVRYEDLKTNLRHELTRIADFLQLEAIQVDKSGWDNVLNRVSFDWMREHQHLFHPISVRWKPGYNFIRSGTVGDHGSIFDTQHRRTFTEAVDADFGGKDLVPEWLHEHCFHK